MYTVSVHTQSYTHKISKKKKKEVKIYGKMDFRNERFMIVDALKFENEEKDGRSKAKLDL